MRKSEQIKDGEYELNLVFCKTSSQLGSLSAFYSTMLHGLPQGHTIFLLGTQQVGEDLYKDGTLAHLLTIDEYRAMMKEQRQERIIKETLSMTARSQNPRTPSATHLFAF